MQNDAVKPMNGHNLMQATARVNRVFKDKPGGLVVDYIGIANDLKAALKTALCDLRDLCGYLSLAFEILAFGISPMGWFFHAKTPRRKEGPNNFERQRARSAAGFLTLDTWNLALPFCVLIFGVWSFPGGLDSEPRRGDKRRPSA